MTNMISLPKVWIARTAGLFILTALAATFFVTPMAMGQSGGGSVTSKFAQQPSVLKGVKANFSGIITSPPPVTFPVKTGSAILNLKITPKVALANITLARWLACDISDPKTGTIYPFTCSVGNINTSTKQILVVIGGPVCPALVSQSVLQKFEGTVIPLNYQTDGVTVAPPPVKAGGTAASGWGSSSVCPNSVA